MSEVILADDQPKGVVNCTEQELSTYLQGLEEGYLAASCLDTSVSGPSRSTPIASKSYIKDKKTVSFHGFPSLRMSAHSTAGHGEEKSTELKADSPVKGSQLPEKEKGSKAIRVQTCGRRWAESFAKLDRRTSSWRIPQSLFGKTEACTLFCGTWPKWGTMRNGVCWERTMPVLRTAASASGSGRSLLDCMWPTPHAGDGNSGRGEYQDRNKIINRIKAGRQVNLSDAVKVSIVEDCVADTDGFQLELTPISGRNRKTRFGRPKFPTPAASDADRGIVKDFSPVTDLGRKQQYHLNQAVYDSTRRWATPKARDWKDTPGMSPTGINPDGSIRDRTDQLPMQVYMSMDAGLSPPAMLNPDWEEWLMGWPLFWTSLQPLPNPEWISWADGDPHPVVPRTANGVANREDRIHAIGNGQVPQCLVLACTVLDLGFEEK